MTSRAVSLSVAPALGDVLESISPRLTPCDILSPLNGAKGVDD